jgi:3-hydroxy-9,10-secoandrosta-1,3,5(10)-triene-9,17-dione monooxygenase
MNAAMTGDDFIGRAHELVPLVKARARQAEELRRLAEDTLRGFQNAGLFRAFQPARFGGFELQPAVSFYEAAMEIAAAPRVERLVLAVLGIRQWHVALFSPRAQGEVWGDDPTALSSSS